MIAMAALTALVWLRMYVVRLREMTTKRIDPQSVATSREASRYLEETAPADNFRNLLEIPVLFYAVSLALAVTGESILGQVLLAWTFVISRTAHTLIHLTYNRVTHRFMVHASGTIVVFLMWLLFALQLSAVR
jgi:hypothetical protein